MPPFKNKKGKSDLAQFFLDHGADLNAREESSQNTPLLLAAFNADEE